MCGFMCVSVSVCVSMWVCECVCECVCEGECVCECECVCVNECKIYLVVFCCVSTDVSLYGDFPTVFINGKEKGC